MRIFLFVFLVFSQSAFALYECPERGRIVLSSAPCDTTYSPVAVSRRTVMALPLIDSRYRVAGTLNGRRVGFLVDTGATTTAISKRVADLIGLSSCVRMQKTTTANGTVSVCVVSVSQFTFGSFALNNVEVSILPNADDEGLLGMNVLRHFEVHQTGKRLIISD